MKELNVLWVIDGRFMTEPMNVMLLSALGKRDRPHCHSHIALLERGEVMSAVRRIKPQIVAASCITGSHKIYLEMFREVKRECGQGVFTILGGPYCSTYPETIAENECLDAIGVYECDEAWPEFLDAFERDREEIHEIRNILTRKNFGRALEKISSSDVTRVRREFYRPRFSDLDSLPYLDRALLDGTPFTGLYKRTHMAGRGCPHRCTYCFEREWNVVYKDRGSMFQRYSPRRFCEELASVKRAYDTRFFKMYDDVFPTYPSDTSWLEEFAEIYPRLVGLPFHCLTRCDIVARDPSVLRVLKRAGAVSISMSIESGNAFIRDHVITRDMSREQMEFAFRHAREVGLGTFSNTILGIKGPVIPRIDDPEFDFRVSEIADDVTYHKVCRQGSVVQIETLIGSSRVLYTDERSRREFLVDALYRLGLRHSQLEYDTESCQFNVEMGASIGEFPILHPYPRTEATRWVIHKGWFDGDFDKLHVSYQTQSPLSCFTPYEKIVQQNLALLATFVMLFSGSRVRLLRVVAPAIAWFCFRVLARIPFHAATVVYEQLYALSKNHMYDSRIYPFPKSWKERFGFWIGAWRLDFLKQFGNTGKASYERKPGPTLGGPVS